MENEKEIKFVLNIVYIFRKYKKNRVTMFEQINQNLFEKFDIMVSGIQCANGYKNVKRENNIALSSNKVFENVSTKLLFKNEFEKIKNIDDSFESEVLNGINYVEINKKISTRRNTDTSNMLSGIKTSEISSKYLQTT